MQTIRTILHPTDFSRHAEQALDVACAIARAHGARLLILHVAPSNEPVTHSGKARGLEPPDVMKTELKSYQLEMEKKLKAVRVPDEKVPVERLLKDGAVGKVIVQTAELTPCDLVVMGTRGQSAPSRALLGSVAEEVSRKASCPVVTVQLPER
jgi:nucleotide-binding universal stress UspA family protein